MKRNLMIIALITLCLFAYSCGGGGAGTTNVPTGENPSLPSELQLQPVQYVAQTGTYIYLKAKVLDGNGMPVTNYAVTFSNLSTSGVLSPLTAPKASGRRASSSSTVTANTDINGNATATLYSTAQGFVTVQASVATTTSPAAPAAQITSKKTVYYSDYYRQCLDSSWIYIYGDGCTPSTTTVSATPYIMLYVDGNNNGIYNETDDLTLFQNTTDDQVSVKAVVFDGAGGYVKNTTVTFAADSAEVTFPTGSTATTNSNGQAYVLAKVTPSTTRTVSTVINITASTLGGAAGMVSLYLNPVTISSISVAATPTIILPDAKATITASLKTSAGTPAPDGTSVTFAASCPPLTSVGYIATPFAQTTGGAATVSFTGPSTSNSCQVTAASAGMSATTYITVAAAAVPVPDVPPDTLSITPGAVTVLAGSPPITFSIAGGYAPYTTTSTDPTKVFNDNGAGGGTANNGIRDGAEGSIWSGSTVNVTIPATAAAGTVDLNVYDGKGKTAKATITIIASGGVSGGALAVSPAAITLAGIAGTSTADNVTFKITGGQTPYSMYSSNTGVVPNVPVTSTTPSTGSFIIDPTSVATATAVTLTVMDALGTTKTVTATVTPATGSLSINPATASLKVGTPVTFYIIGGSTTTTTNYTITSAGAGTATVPANPILTGSTLSFTVTPTVAGAVTITVIDAAGGTSATSTVTVY